MGTEQLRTSESSREKQQNWCYLTINAVIQQQQRQKHKGFARQMRIAGGISVKFISFRIKSKPKNENKIHFAKEKSLLQRIRLLLISFFSLFSILENNFFALCESLYGFNVEKKNTNNSVLNCQRCLIFLLFFSSMMMMMRIPVACLLATATVHINPLWCHHYLI